MFITRKNFIGGTLAASFFSKSVFASTSHRLCFGVVSDIHLDLSEVRANSFRKALKGFRDAGVDAVLITGDIAHKGRVDQLEQVRDIWNEVFPGGKRPDGGKVEKLFLPGNHDWNLPKERKANDPVYIADDFANNWQRVLGEKFEPVKKVEVKGYSFVLVDWFAVENIDKWFEEHKKEFDPSKPFFYGQHPHLRGTCYDPKVFYWGAHDSGLSTKTLSNYPNAIAFSGHSHFPISDPYSIWQEAFTSINCGSTWCSSRDYVPIDESLNGPSYDYYRRPQLLPRIPVNNEVAPGMIVKVFDSHIRIERTDYLSGLSLGEDWVIPLDSANRPYSSANRGKKIHTAPSFPKGAALSVQSVKNEFKILSKSAAPSQKKCIEQIKLSFPQACSTQIDRVFGYEISALVDGEKKFSRFLLADDYHLPYSLRQTTPVFYVDKSEFKTGSKVLFEVRAMERFGAKSSSLTAEYLI